MDLAAAHANRATVPWVVVIGHEMMYSTHDASHVAQAKLLFTLTAPAELLVLAPQFPASWVLKPVGAGHSDGVLIVRDGWCVNRGRAGGVPLDLATIVAELEALVSAGGAWHNGTFFAWNVSKFTWRSSSSTRAARAHRQTTSSPFLVAACCGL